MDEDTQVRFPHRYNYDGTWDSICPRCFQTIARARDEGELERAELIHDCKVQPLCELPPLGKPGKPGL